MIPLSYKPKEKFMQPAIAVAKRAGDRGAYPIRAVNMRLAGPALAEFIAGTTRDAHRPGCSSRRYLFLESPSEGMQPQRPALLRTSKKRIGRSKLDAECSLIGSTHSIYIRSDNLEVVNLHPKLSRVYGPSYAQADLDNSGPCRKCRKSTLLCPAASART